MANITDEFFAYKAAVDGKQAPTAKADISKEFDNYKTTISKPSTEPRQSFGEIFNQVYGGSAEEQFGPVAAERTVKALPSLLPVAGMMAGSALAGPGVLAGMAGAGLGAAAGKAGEVAITGEGTAKEVGVEALKSGAIEGLFRGLGVTASAVKNYVVNSPRILNTIADLLSSATKGEFTSSNLKTALERAGVPGAMKAIEGETDAIKFAPRGKGNLAIENVNVATKQGAEKMAEVQKGLKEMRILAGQEVAKADDLLIEAARRKGESIINLEPIAKELGQEILAIKNNPVLSPVVNTRKLEHLLKSLNKEPNLSIDDAIKTKRMISSIFEDFSNKGVMTVKDADMVSSFMAKTRVKIKELIHQKARDLGVTQYDEVYSKFGEFADNYDETLQPLFGSKEGAKFLEDRFIQLSNEITRRGNVLENVQNTSKLLFPAKNAEQVGKGINDLTDLLIIRSIYQDVGAAPSSGLVGAIRKFVVSPVAKGFVKAGNITEAGKAVAPAAPSAAAPIANLAMILAKKLAPDQIKELYKEGQLDKPTAAQMLRENHGFQ